MQHLARELAVADEVVVHQEHHAKALPAQHLQLGDHLLRAFGAGYAAEDGDDVAELAQERAAAGELDVGNQHLARVEQVVARQRQHGHVRALHLFVPRAPGLAAGHRLQELRPAGVGLADEDHVAQAGEELFVDAGVRAADDDDAGEVLQRLQDLAHALALHDHARQADDVVIPQRRQVDVVGVLVEERHLVGLLDERRQQRQRATGLRRLRLPGQQGQQVVHAVVRRHIAWLDQGHPQRPAARAPADQRTGHEAGALESVYADRLGGLDRQDRMDCGLHAACRQTAGRRRSARSLPEPCGPVIWVQMYFQRLQRGLRKRAVHRRLARDADSAIFPVHHAFRARRLS